MEMEILVKLVIAFSIIVCCESRTLSDTEELVNRHFLDMKQSVAAPPKLLEPLRDLRSVKSRNTDRADLNEIINRLIKASKPDYVVQRSWFTEDGAIRGTSTKATKAATFMTTPPTSTTTTTASTNTGTTKKPLSVEEIWKIISKWMNVFG